MARKSGWDEFVAYLQKNQEKLQKKDREKIDRINGSHSGGERDE